MDLIAVDTVNVEVPLGNFQCRLIGSVLPRARDARVYGRFTRERVEREFPSSGVATYTSDVRIRGGELLSDARIVREPELNSPGYAELLRGVVLLLRRS